MQKELVTDTAIAKEAANRWTDNQDQVLENIFAHVYAEIGCYLVGPKAPTE